MENRYHIRTVSGKDEKIRSAIVKFPKTKSKNKISINILYLVEFREMVDNIDFHEGNYK